MICLQGLSVSRYDGSNIHRMRTQLHSPYLCLLKNDFRQHWLHGQHASMLRVADCFGLPNRSKNNPYKPYATENELQPLLRERIYLLEDPYPIPKSVDSEGAKTTSAEVVIRGKQ